MAKWIFLLFTMASVWLTVDAFRMKGPMKEPLLSRLPSAWKHGFEHLSLAKQDKIQERSAYKYLGLGDGLLAWLFLAMTLLLAALTINAFLERVLPLVRARPQSMLMIQ